MPRLASVNVAVQRPPQKGEVSDQVEDLVTDELVPKPQRPGDDPDIVEDDRVLEGAAARQAARPHR